MQKIILIIIIIIPFLQAAKCNKTNDYFNPEIPTVKLSTSVNNTAETIALGDTLKFTLIVPDTITSISKIDGSTSKIFVSSLQNCFWAFTFYSIDTLPFKGNRITDVNSAFVTNGIMYLEKIYTTTTKPYTATLNIVPKIKGLYYVEFGRQETKIEINNSLSAGLRMNMDALNKHWNLIERFNPGFTNEMTQLDNQGYGWYCFKVN